MPAEYAGPEGITVGPLATNCWIYPWRSDAPPGGHWDACRDRLCVVIDPGGDSAVIGSRLKRLNLVPRFILLTHGHYDHLAGLPGLVSYCRETWGLDPAIGIHEEDAASLGPQAQEVHRESFIAAVGSAEYVDALWEPLPSPTMTFLEGDEVGPVTVLHLPGHSPGSAGFYDKAAQRLFSGDTLFKNGVGRDDLPGGDYGSLTASLKRLFAMPPQTAVYPGHGGSTTLGAEQRRY